MSCGFSLLIRLVIVLVLASETAIAAVSCVVSTSGIAFGNYSSLRGEKRDTSGVMTVSCSGTVGDAVNYRIAFTPGTGSYRDRLLAAGGTRVRYNLFTDIGRSQVWGDGTNGTAVVSDSFTLAASPTTRQYTVYGRIAGAQRTATANSYRDYLTIVLTY